MGYQLTGTAMQSVLDAWNSQYLIYGPKRMEGEGMYSDTDVIRYGLIEKPEDIEWHHKSDYSFKEVLLPITQMLFYFTEDSVKEADMERNKKAVIFLRSCDMHAVRRLDEIYLRNGFEDYFYKRLRDEVKFVVMGCRESFENCFCVSMGTNETDAYDLAVEERNGNYYIDSKWEEADELLRRISDGTVPVTPAFVKTNEVNVTIPDEITLDVMKSDIWEEYDSRCINCGRCNFVCPTCTCFTMQDIFYTDNGRAGERRRVHASCMTDGYTDVAGGGSYRKKNGERMRFKVLHKVYDYKKRYGYHMCTGCGRCDDVCPEYISFSHCINKMNRETASLAANKLPKAVKEAESDDVK